MDVQMNWPIAAELAILELDCQADSFEWTAADNYLRAARRADKARQYRAAAMCYSRYLADSMVRIPNRRQRKAWARSLYVEYADAASPRIHLSLPPEDLPF